jgi:hypothetical protein
MVSFRLSSLVSRGETSSPGFETPYISNELCGGKVSAGLNFRQTDSQLYRVRSNTFKVRMSKIDVRAIGPPAVAPAQDKL